MHNTEDGGGFEDVKAIEASYNNEVHDLVKEIDYADRSFILQNLQMALPKYREDMTFTLQGRKDTVELISHQICFYCYCTLQAFLQRPAPPTILVFGDGYLGTRVVNELVKFELTPFLKVFSRGIIKAKEWKEKGITCNCSILHLLNGHRPDIVILNTESGQFGPLSQMLLNNQIINKSTCIISASFGVERRKIFGSLNVHSIFRTYCEPTNVLKKVECSIFGKDLYKKKKKDFEDDQSSDEDDNDDDEPSIAFDDDAISEDEELPPEEEKPEPESEDEEEGLNDIQISAKYLAKRTQSLKYFIHILENFYVLNGMNLGSARHRALKSALGYDHGAEVTATASVDVLSAPDIPLIPPSPVGVGGPGNEMVLGRYYNHNLRACLDSMVSYKVQMFQAQLALEMSCEAIQELATTPIGFDRESIESGEPSTILAAGSPGQKSKRYNPVYNEAYIKSVFDKDNNIGGYSGDGFDYMALIDNKLKG